MSRIESVTVAKELVEARSGKTDLNESSSVFRCFPTRLVLNHHAQKQGLIPWNPLFCQQEADCINWYTGRLSAYRTQIHDLINMKPWKVRGPWKHEILWVLDANLLFRYGSWSCQVFVQFLDDWGKGPNANGDSPLKEEAVYFSVWLLWEMFTETMRSTCPFLDQ